MLSIQITGEQDLLDRLKTLPADVQQALLAKAQELADALALYVQDEKLSGQVLAARTGKLRDSIGASVAETADGFSASVFSGGDLPYAAIQEYGGTIPAHEIAASRAKALAFQQAGKMVFARYVNWPGATLPERSYLRSALADRQDDILSELADSVGQALNP